MKEYIAPKITVIELKSQEAFAADNNDICVYAIGSCPSGDGYCWTNQLS
mgnify:CR=1 FL=1